MVESKIIAPVSAFGEVLVAQPVARVQLDAVYGIRSTDVDTSTDGVTGGVTAVDGSTGMEIRCSTGTANNGYGKLTSKKAVRYRTGQGVAGRFTARYSAGVANSSQRAGFMNIGTELSFGYNGVDFGVLHRTGGRVEIRTMTVTVGAAGAETATVTLNGVNHNVVLANGNTVATANTLAAASYSGWTVSVTGSVLTFINTSVGPKSGDYSFSSTGAATASFASISVGVNPTDNWVKQADWNGLRLTGGDQDPFTLNPLKGNVFEIRYQYLGFGAIEFAIEDPNTGEFVVVHRIKYANANTSPSLDFPIMRMGVIAINSGNTSNITVHTASMAGFIEGSIQHFRPPNSQISSKTGIGTSWVSLLQLRNKRVFASRQNLSEMIFHGLEIAAEGTKPVEFSFWLNPVVTGTPLWAEIGTTTSIAEYDVSASTITSGQMIYAAGLGKSSNKDIDLEKLDIRASNGDVVALAVRASQGTADATGSLIWVED